LLIERKKVTDDYKKFLERLEEADEKGLDELEKYFQILEIPYY